MDRAPHPPDARAAALRRAHFLVAELIYDVATLQARLPQLDLPLAADESGLATGELHAAFTAARRASEPVRRARWADVLLPGP